MNAMETNEEIEELYKENDRLLAQLLLANKCIEILEKFKYFLEAFMKKCKCFLIKNNNILLYELLHEFDSFVNENKNHLFNNQEFDNNFDNSFDDFKSNKVWVKLNGDSVKEQKVNQYLDYFDTKSNICYYYGIKNTSIIKNKDNKQEKRVVTQVAEPSNSNPTIDYFNDKLVIKQLVVKSTEIEEPKVEVKTQHVPRVKYLCGWNKCKFYSYSERKTNDHKNVHTGERPHVCSIDNCGKTFRTHIYLKKHQKSHFDQIKYFCEWPECEAKFKTKYSYETHKKRHLSAFPFKCEHDNCSESFICPLSLRQHNNLVHLGKVLKCKKCLKTFKTYGKFYYHKLTKHSAKRMTCDWPGCEYSTFVHKYMNEHKIRRHTQEKNYVCIWPDCEKRFISQKRLDLHMKAIHCEEKTERCDWPDCNASFGHRKYLLTHLLRHKRRFKCQYKDCGKRFSENKALRNHIKRQNHQIIDT